VDRAEALQTALAQQTTSPAARAVVLAALKDKYYQLRGAAAEGLKLDNKDVAKAAAPVLRKLATTEKEPHALAAVLNALGQLKDKKDERLVANELATNPSLTVQGAALRALGGINPSQALAKAKAYEVDAPASLSAAMLSVYAQQGGSAQWTFIRDHFDAANGRGKYNYIGPMTQILGRLDDPKAFSEDVTRLQQMAMVPQLKAYGYDKMLIAALQKGAEAQRGKPNASQNQATVDAAVQAIQAAK